MLVTYRNIEFWGHLFSPPLSLFFCDNFLTVYSRVSTFCDFSYQGTRRLVMKKDSLCQLYNCLNTVWKCLIAFFNDFLNLSSHYRLLTECRIIKISTYSIQEGKNLHFEKRKKNYLLNLNKKGVKNGKIWIQTVFRQ